MVCLSITGHPFLSDGWETRGSGLAVSLRSWGTQSFLGVDSPHLHIRGHLNLKQKLLRQRVQEGILDKCIHLLIFIKS